MLHPDQESTVHQMKITVVHVQLKGHEPETFEIRGEWSSPEEISAKTSEYIYTFVDHTPTGAGTGSVYMVGVRSITEMTGEISVFNETDTFGHGGYTYVDEARDVEDA